MVINAFISPQLRFFAVSKADDGYRKKKKGRRDDGLFGI
jgi:hypothetical protein